MRVVLYIFISLGALLVGGVVGCSGGWALGWFSSLGYQRQGPSDPGDAPVYLMLGLMFLGTCVGAIAGFATGVGFCEHLHTKKLKTRPR